MITIANIIWQHVTYDDILLAARQSEPIVLVAPIAKQLLPEIIEKLKCDATLVTLDRSRPNVWNLHSKSLKFERVSTDPFPALQRSGIAILCGRVIFLGDVRGSSITFSGWISSPNSPYGQGWETLASKIAAFGNEAKRATLTKAGHG